MEVPLAARLTLGRAATQRIAEAIGADVLHIKGTAVDPVLRPSQTSGTDIDILVRPAHVDALDAELRHHGWAVHSSFRDGSPFGHAQTYVHPQWGVLDLHRFFPGIRRDPTVAFERLWRKRATIDIAGVSCAVPDLPGQAVILLLNAARGGSHALSDPHFAWRTLDPDVQDQVRIERDALLARVGVAAALGELDTHRRAPDYLLWKAISQGGTRLAEWTGRVRAAHGVRAKAEVLRHAATVNRDQLAHRLDRNPTRRDVLIEAVARPARGITELARAARWRKGTLSDQE